MIKFHSIDVLGSSYIIHIDNLIVTLDDKKVVKSIREYDSIRCSKCDLMGTNKCKIVIHDGKYVVPCELLDETGESHLRCVGNMSLILSSKIKVSSNPEIDKLLNNYERLVSLLDEVNEYVENNSKK